VHVELELDGEEEGHEGGREGGKEGGREGFIKRTCTHEFPGKVAMVARTSSASP